VREELNKSTDRVNVVFNPLKVVITNYPEGQEEQLSALNNPEDENPTYRSLAFSREIYIERDDFMLDPPKKFFRMGPGRDVRLKFAYILHCEDFKTNEAGEIEEVYCTYYPDSKSGEDTSGVKAKGTLHWVSAVNSIPVKVNLYDRLFTDPTPDGHEDKAYDEFLNPDALVVNNKARAEASLKEAQKGQSFQFMRKGYFVVDEESKPDNIVFNRTVTLRDSWAKKQQK